MSNQGSLYKNGIDVNLYTQPPPPTSKSLSYYTMALLFRPWMLWPSCTCISIEIRREFGDFFFYYVLFIMYLCTQSISPQSSFKIWSNSSKMLHQETLFFCFYLVWFDVGNDQSNDLTKKEKKHLYIHSPSFSDFQKELKTFSVWEQGAIWHAGQGVQNWKKTENCRQQIVDSDFEVYKFLFWYRRCTYTWCLDVILFAQNLKHSLQWRNRVT